ncbi:alkaline phosphatase D family protein [Thauera sinica]|uniref:Alkaline phosphatase D family protein n=1 Tax=Thauera sinica TaxID=2665146 RepID=A0ABW1ANV4_9RHOO|nr:alkaline phosphatase D family protein [Thauera sp. K11]ATE60511.1 alkaline phosphatase [Thauera sp. K11]
MSSDTMSGRRAFIRTVGLGMLAASPLARASGRGGASCADEVFAHGVASGDPLVDRVILWTRVSPRRPGRLPVFWEVAADRSFHRPLRSGRSFASAGSDYTVKVDVDGLRPGTRYFYRFRVDGRVSPVGCTRTLPVGAVAQVRLAVLSCSNYPAGYFHVYAELAKMNDVHAAVHLGDYIYEYGRGGYASEDAAALRREVEPAGELLALEDYRRRYAQYRSDPDLQAVHAAMPFICVWDDHEVANDTWREGAENHDDASEGDFFARRAAALQAYHEWLPTRLPDAERPERIYRSFAFGDLLDLHMLDTRVIGRDRQLGYANYMDASGFDAARFAADLADPSRSLMGFEQLQWLQNELAASSATWSVLGQQVLMGRMNVPAPLVLGQVSFSAYSALVAKAQTAPQTLTPQEQAILAQPAIPYNLDAWDGYAAERELVLGTALSLDKNLVVLAGDTHNAWASDLLTHTGIPVGVEFATPGVTSPGLEAYFPAENPAAVAAGLTQIVGPLKYANTGDRGFMLVTATPDACRADWRYVSSVKRRRYSNFAGPGWLTQPGAGNRRLLPAGADAAAGMRRTDHVGAV